MLPLHFTLAHQSSCSSFLQYLHSFSSFCLKISDPRYVCVSLFTFSGLCSNITLSERPCLTTFHKIGHCPSQFLYIVLFSSYNYLTLYVFVYFIFTLQTFKLHEGGNFVCYCELLNPHYLEQYLAPIFVEWMNHCTDRWQTPNPKGWYLSITFTSIYGTPIMC